LPLFIGLTLSLSLSFLLGLLALLGGFLFQRRLRACRLGGLCCGPGRFRGI
jgi:hypothetical protein